MDRYEKLEKIGEGSYGKVYKGRDRKNDQIVALKEVGLCDQWGGIQTMLVREIPILKEMKHPNIVRLLDVAQGETSVYLVFEYMDLDLDKFIKSPPISKDSRVIKRFLHQILQGVSYVHSYKIIHRDLKPKNLLVDRNNNVLKIADFGLSRDVSVPMMSYTPGVGSSCYRAPELLLQVGYSSSADMWSVGCIFAEMVTGQRLFKGSNRITILLKIFSIVGLPTETNFPGLKSWGDLSWAEKSQYNRKSLVEIIEGLEPAGIDLLFKMLCLDPNGRISADVALEHEYFEDAHVE